MEQSQHCSLEWKLVCLQSAVDGRVSPHSGNVSFLIEISVESISALHHDVPSFKYKHGRAGLSANTSIFWGIVRVIFALLS